MLCCCHPKLTWLASLVTAYLLWLVYLLCIRILNYPASRKMPSKGDSMYGNALHIGIRRLEFNTGCICGNPERCKRPSGIHLRRHRHPSWSHPLFQVHRVQLWQPFSSATSLQLITPQALFVRLDSNKDQQSGYLVGWWSYLLLPIQNSLPARLFYSSFLSRGFQLGCWLLYAC